MTNNFNHSLRFQRRDENTIIPPEYDSRFQNAKVEYWFQLQNYCKFLNLFQILIWNLNISCRNKKTLFDLVLSFLMTSFTRENPRSSKTMCSISIKMIIDSICKFTICYARFWRYAKWHIHISNSYFGTCSQS